MRILNLEQIKAILPHREPFLFIDEIVELEDGKRARAIKNLTGEEEFFKGHFPGHPIMPGVLIVEAMTQTSILLYYTAYKENLQKRPDYYLGSVKAQFKQAVVPGCQLQLEAQTVKLLPAGAFVEAKALVKDVEIAKAELIFAIKQ